MFKKIHFFYASVITIATLNLLLIYYSKGEHLQLRLLKKHTALRKVLNCNDVKITPRIRQRGKYWVLYNYFQAEASFRCHESITYTTHSDFTFLDNVQPLVEKWRGPISIALYSPVSDYDATIKSIRYLRDCGSDLIREYVTFHIFFEMEHMPKHVYSSSDMFTQKFNCSVNSPLKTTQDTYRTENSLTYPVNVARNIAREMAQTHFVLASDIELYPSLNVIPQFLDMILRNEKVLSKMNKPKVFVFNLFEIMEHLPVPETKRELQYLIKTNGAFPFHLKICAVCHRVPRQEQWINFEQTDAMNIFTIGKRLGKFAYWEPIYIGTNEEPLYDERLSWDGKSDKMGQGYQMCLSDYEFLVLNNAFLVHKPGIKVQVYDPKRNIHMRRSSALIKDHILPELNTIYGRSSGCKL